MQYSVGEIITTRKPHACKNNVFEIVRTGADIKIKCAKCNKIIMLEYDKFLKAIK